MYGLDVVGKCAQFGVYMLIMFYINTTKGVIIVYGDDVCLT